MNLSKYLLMNSNLLSAVTTNDFCFQWKPMKVNLFLVKVCRTMKLLTLGGWRNTLEWNMKWQWTFSFQKDRLILCAVIYYGGGLFRMALKSVEILLPHYIAAIETVYTESVKLRYVSFAVFPFFFSISGKKFFEIVLKLLSRNFWPIICTIYHKCSALAPEISSFWSETPGSDCRLLSALFYWGDKRLKNLFTGFNFQKTRHKVE